MPYITVGKGKFQATSSIYYKDCGASGQRSNTSLWKSAATKSLTECLPFP